MAWVMTLIFTTLFSGIGWSLGESQGIGTAVILSGIGLVVGWVAAKRFMAWLEQ